MKITLISLGVLVFTYFEYATGPMDASFTIGLCVGALIGVAASWNHESKDEEQPQLS